MRFVCSLLLHFCGYFIRLFVFVVVCSVGFCFVSVCMRCLFVGACLYFVCLMKYFGCCCLFSNIIIIVVIGVFVLCLMFYYFVVEVVLIWLACFCVFFVLIFFLL